MPLIAVSHKFKYNFYPEKKQLEKPIKMTFGDVPNIGSSIIMTKCLITFTFV